jgi:hypothetical protein
MVTGMAALRYGKQHGINAAEYIISIKRRSNGVYEDNACATAEEVILPQ